ncbi:MAG: DUF3604 domain-containing protein, partial [Verrucomicrobiota bacterium]
ERTQLEAVSNPVDVRSVPAERSLFWGDLHSHTRYSHDGVGDNSFFYARHISGLDFYAAADHSIAPNGDLLRGLSEAYWEEYVARTEKYDDPPRFVTIHAYEASFGRPYGHHNVYFRDQPGPLIAPSKVTLEELWKLLKAGDAVTIPHHTGKFPGGVDFNVHDPVFRRNFEIYSGHGLSEYYNPAHPLSFEHSKFTSDAMSLRSPTFAQDTWKQGLVLSTIASSDDHRSQPGQPHYGLAAIRAPKLTRDDIFQALHDRHTYGTSGAKIILEFDVNGTPMGQTVALEKPPKIHVRACGTDTIEWIELLRWYPGREKFEVVKTWWPNMLDFEDEYRDDSFQKGAIYYVRLQQQKKVRGLAAMAWSSPVWTN